MVLRYFEISAILIIKTEEVNYELVYIVYEDCFLTQVGSLLDLDGSAWVGSLVDLNSLAWVGSLLDLDGTALVGSLLDLDGSVWVGVLLDLDGLSRFE